MIANIATLALAGASFSSVLAQSNVPKFQYGTPNPYAPGVRGANRNGPTNPAQPSLNTPINQTSNARLASINSIDDWCTFGPQPSPNNQTLGYLEADTVAYCTKPRNNARVIPDGTLTAVHFVKTPLYVQVMALGDFTKINMAPGDEGGELDPHGATNMGNPVGGNVTSNVQDGKTDVFYEEWMNYISYNQVCFRVCIAGTDVAPTPLECQHTLDEMGCNWVMPGDYSDNSFDTCDADSAYPPGLYPQPDGSTSTFQQYFTGSYTANGQVISYTNGSPDQTTPTAAYSMPSSSNCVKTNTIANGIKSLIQTSSAPASSSTRAAGSGSGSSSGASGMSTSVSGGSGAVASNSVAGASASSTGKPSSAEKMSAGPLVATLVAVAGVMVGAAAML